MKQSSLKEDELIQKGERIYGKSLFFSRFKFHLEDSIPLYEKEKDQIKSSSKNKRVKLGKIVMKNGGSYEGEWKNEMRDGQGVHIWVDSSKYEGEWKED